MGGDPEEESLDALEERLRRGPSGVSLLESERREEDRLVEPPPPSLGTLERRLSGRRSLRERWRDTRKSTRIIVGVVALAALGLVVAKGPRWMLDRGHEAHVDCSNASYHEEPTASLACEGAGHVWLLLAGLAPWTRAEAEAADREDRAAEIATRLDRMAEVVVEAAGRDGAADDLARFMALPGFAPDRRTTDWAFGLIANTGALEATVKHAALARGTFDTPRALRAAIALGDHEAATRIAEAVGPTADRRLSTYDEDLARGAWLCLVGKRDAGRAALERAAADYLTRVTYPYTEAQMALYACGAPPGSQTNSIHGDAIWAAEIAAASMPETSLRRLLPGTGYGDQAHDVTEPLFADWLAGGDRDPADVVAMAGYVQVHLARGTTRWNVGGSGAQQLLGSQPVAMDPVRLEKAATKLEALLADIEAKRVAIEPIAGGSLVEQDRYRYDEAPRLARKRPVATLRAAATYLWLDLASEHAIRRDVAGLRRALAHLPAADRATLGAVIGPWLARAGDRDAASEAFAPVREGNASLDRLGAELDAGLVALERRDAPAALAAVRRSSETLAAAEREIRASRLASVLGDDIVQSMKSSVGWIEAAAILMGGAGDPSERVPTPKYYEGAELPPDWLALARSPDAVRKDARLRMLGWSPGIGERAVLPAVLYVLREVARDGVDPDVYVDAMLGLSFAENAGMTVLEARAVAARMRGDGATADRWNARAAKVRPFFADTSGVLLARLMRLD